MKEKTKKVLYLIVVIVNLNLKHENSEDVDERELALIEIQGVLDEIVEILEHD